MSSATLTILGCGATGNDLGWATSGYLIRICDDLTLLDCGAGVTAEFERQGFDVRNLSRVIVSHTHIDHVSDLAYLIQSIYLTRRKDPLDVYLPEDFVGQFEAYLQSVYLFPERLSFPLRLQGYREGEVLADPFTVLAHQNRHLDHYADIIKQTSAPNKMLSHSLELQIGGNRLFYSADITSFEEIREFLPGCAYVLVESTHVDLREIIAYAETADVGCFVITHLGQGEEIGRVCTTVEQANNERIIPAEPGLILEL